VVAEFGGGDEAVKAGRAACGQAGLASAFKSKELAGRRRNWDYLETVRLWATRVLFPIWFFGKDLEVVLDGYAAGGLSPKWVEKGRAHTGARLATASLLH